MVLLDMCYLEIKIETRLELHENASKEYKIIFNNSIFNLDLCNEYPLEIDVVRLLVLKKC